MRRMKILVTLFSVLALCCTPANAQYLYEPTWQPHELMLYNNVTFNPIVNNIIDNGDDEDWEDTDPPRADRAELSTISTIFTPSLSVRRRNLAGFVNKTRAYDPAGAAQMEQLFASTDIIGLIGDLMKAYGLNPNDLADVYAVYWVNAWQASRGDNSDISPATYQAVSAQAARGLAESPDFVAASDAQKQEMAEALMIQAAMIAAHMESAAGDPAQLRAIAKAVTQGAKASGLDLANMELTEQGFVKGG